MAITRRTLTKWRKEALKLNADLIANKPGIVYSIDHKNEAIISNDRILQMTQELLDLDLLKEASNA
jgi:hypothetical protein